MLLSSLILTLFLVAVETRSNVKICTFLGSLMKCALMSGQDTFNVTADVDKDLLEQVITLKLTVGTPRMPYQPPVDSKAIAYPDWSLMPNVRDIEIGFYLKAGTEEFRLNLDAFQYLPADSLKGVKGLVRFNLSSNSREVTFEVGLLSESHHLNLLWVEGCMISAAGESWNNVQNVSDLKLIGKQVGNLDLGWLPLDTLTSLDLSLSEIEGVNGTTAQKMTKLKYLSLAVAQGKSLDWTFIKTLASQLQTLKLDGYNLGNISSNSFPTSSTIRYLTLSNSTDTELIGAYTFIGDYDGIELNGMPRLMQIQDYAMFYKLSNLTVTNMKILSAMPTSLGDGVSPKWVHLTNNPMLLEVPVNMFRDTSGYMNNRIAEVDVLGTKLDVACPCEASYLAAMSVVGGVNIHANCLKTWVQEGKCQQGNNCWSFSKVCNETCVAKSSNPLKYSCECRSNEMLLPDEFSCVSFDGCIIEFENSWRCPDYNVTCFNENDKYLCHCENPNMWDSTKMACVINNLIPIVSPTSIIPNTTKTAMTIVPANTTAKTAMTLVSANTTAKTAMTIIPANTTAKTAMTIVPANTTAKTATTKTAKTQTLKTPTDIVSTMSLEPAITSAGTNSTTHTNYTIVTIVTNNHTIVSIQTATPQPIKNPQLLPTWEIALIVAGSVVVVAIFSIILVVVIYLGYRKKKSVQVFPRQISPTLLDENDLN